MRSRIARSWLARVSLAAALLGGVLAGGSRAQPADPILVIHGEPYATGDVTLAVSAPDDPGAPIWLALGLDPLPLLAPIGTGKGPFFVGTLTHAKPFGAMPANGLLEVPVTLPPIDPQFVGLHIVTQMLLPGRLSNPATIPLDDPYFLAGDAIQLVSPTPLAGASFGDVHAVGDFDDDGELDLAVGAWFEDGAFVNTGSVYVLWGPGFTDATTLTSPTPATWHLFGLGMHATDVTGDGVDDLIVAEGSGFPDQPADPGKLWVYSGGRLFAAASPLGLVSPASGEDAGNFGRRLIVGDWNHDGHADIAAKVCNADVQALDRAGRVDVFWGPGFTGVTPLLSPDPSELSFFGSALATADVNGDGIDDIVEGSGRANYDGVDNLGRIHVFLGPTLSPQAPIDNPLPMGFNSRFGNALAAADFNGDGMDEIVSTDQHGHAYVFWAPAFTTYQLLNQPPSPGGGTSSSFGYFLDVGDVNADGFLDVAVAAPFVEGTGVVFVYLGPYLASPLILRDTPPELFADFGWGLSLTDLDGDGRAELISGSDTGDVAGIGNAGRLTVFDFGN